MPNWKGCCEVGGVHGEEGCIVFGCIGAKLLKPLVIVLALGLATDVGLSAAKPRSD